MANLRIQRGNNMADITEHLAEIAKVLNCSGYHTAAANTREAIEEIERLRGQVKGLEEVLDHAVTGDILAEIERLRTRLRRIADLASGGEGPSSVMDEIEDLASKASNDEGGERGGEGPNDKLKTLYATGKSLLK
jgi:uncharacterized coiled-coil DUF342 family protein